MKENSLYYLHSAVIELFSNDGTDLVDKCYSTLLEKGLEPISSPIVRKKKSKSVLNLFEDFDLPEGQSATAVSTSMKEINNILEPTIKGSTIRTVPVDPKQITVAEFRDAYYKIMQLEHPDQYLMRFIRARKYHLRKALDMLIRAIKFQIIFQVEKIRMLGDTRLPIHELTGKTFVYNTDEGGRPILYVNTALHDKNGATPSEFEEVSIYVVESMRCFVKYPISNIVLVFNMTNFGVQNMDNTLTKFITACTQDYYPESLFKCYVVNAPWVFNSFWKIIKNWLDPVVQAKVEFCSDEDLRKHLPKLPKILNPESKFEYSYIPPSEADFKFVANRNEIESLALLNDYLEVVKKFEDCTKEWIKKYNFEKSSNNSDEDLKKRAEVVKKEKLAEEDEKSGNKILRRSSTHETFDSFVSATSELFEDESAMDFSKAITYEEIDAIRNRIIVKMHQKYILFDRYIRCPTHYHRAKVIVKDKINWE